MPDKKLVISVANLPKKFTFSRDPLEREMEAQEILAEMGVCPHCKEVGACGCPNPNVAKPCYNCGSPHDGLGNFCGRRCKAEFIGEV